MILSSKLLEMDHKVERHSDTIDSDKRATHKRVGRNASTIY